MKKQKFEPAPATIDLARGMVVAGNMIGREKPILATVEPLVIHEVLTKHACPEWITITAPCGISLGYYSTVKKATSAAKIIAKAVVDKNGDTLETLFGSEDAGREVIRRVTRFMP